MSKFSNPKLALLFGFSLFLISIYLQGSDLFVGSIGDSRAILGSKDSSDSLVATQLTVDLKPDLPSMSNPLLYFHELVCDSNLLDLFTL